MALAVALNFWTNWTCFHFFLQEVHACRFCLFFLFFFLQEPPMMVIILLNDEYFFFSRIPFYVFFYELFFSHETGTWVMKCWPQGKSQNQEGFMNFPP